MFGATYFTNWDPKIKLGLKSIRLDPTGKATLRLRGLRTGPELSQNTLFYCKQETVKKKVNYSKFYTPPPGLVKIKETVCTYDDTPVNVYLVDT